MIPGPITLSLSLSLVTVLQKLPEQARSTWTSGLLFHRARSVQVSISLSTAGVRDSTHINGDPSTLLLI